MSAFICLRLSDKFINIQKYKKEQASITCSSIVVIIIVILYVICLHSAKTIFSRVRVGLLFSRKLDTCCQAVRQKLDNAKLQPHASKMHLKWTVIVAALTVCVNSNCVGTIASKYLRILLLLTVPQVILDSGISPYSTYKI